MQRGPDIIWQKGDSTESLGLVNLELLKFKGDFTSFLWYHMMLQIGMKSQWLALI